MILWIKLNQEVENKWGLFSFSKFILTSTSVTITLVGRGLGVSWRLWPALRLSFSRRTRPWVLLRSNSTWQIREMDTGRGLEENKWTENKTTVKMKDMFLACNGNNKISLLLILDRQKESNVDSNGNKMKYACWMIFVVHKMQSYCCRSYINQRCVRWCNFIKM